MGQGTKVLVIPACRPEFKSPTIHTNLGVVACVCNPNTSPSRRKMSEKKKKKLPEAGSPAGPVSTSGEQETLSQIR